MIQLLFNKFIKIVHFTSLDVVFGALAYQSYFYYFFYHELPPLAYITGLFSGIWMVYLLDRKWDTILKQIPDERHQFQMENKTFINVILILLIILGGISALYLPKEIIQYGMGLVLYIFIYWILLPLFKARNWNYIKEFLTASIYAFGVLLVSWLHHSNIHLIYLYALFTLLVWHHLCLFEVLEKPKRFFYHSLLKIIEFLWFGILIIFVILQEVAWWELLPLFISMIFQLYIHYFYHNLKSRFWAEMAYLSPIIYFTFL